MPRAFSGPACIFALEGPSGVGKSTLGRELARQIGAVFLAEAAESMRPRPSLEYATRGELERLELRLVREEMVRFRRARLAQRQGRHVVADTGFLGPLSYSAGLAALDPRWDVVRPVRRKVLDGIASGTLGAADHTLYLDADVRTLRSRVAADQTHHPAELTARHWRVAEWERRYWEKVDDGRVSFVDARGAPTAVIDLLRRVALPAMRQTRARPDQADSLVAALSFVAVTGATVSRIPRGRAAAGNR